MKAKDLMIGDWVYSVFSEHPCIVEGIEWNESEYAFVKISGVDGYKCIESLLPIPLTPEILEKNGWEKRPTGYVFYTDGKRYDDSLWYIFGSNTFVVNTAEFQIKYVHELQHVLRLYGMEKEIIL